jgi:hypothetical protein
MKARPRHDEQRQEEASPEPPPGPLPERTVLSAEEARQGEIILGRYGRWIWIGSFALIALLVLVLGFWA